MCQREGEPTCLLRGGVEYLPVVFIPVLPAVFRAGKPLAPLGFADSLCEQQDLVARHPDRNPDLLWSGLKP